MGISVHEILVLLVLLTFILWIIAFVNILRSDFTGNNKLVWLLVVTLVPLIGSIAYFFIGRKQKVKKG
ncbi:MAG: PLDc N-terminal domain-containing protein [Desulfobacterales bacterium]|nr:PLDc N-terminal domain-containing protein [Desulfobacterales bacterium]